MVGRPSVSTRTSSSRPTARDSSAPLRRYGPSRRRSSGLGRPPSPATSRASSCRALFARHIAGEGAPEPAGGPGANAGDQALKSRRARQQHLLRHQPGGRAVEQHARPVRARPAQGVEPARQAEADGRIGELAVAVALRISAGMQPSDPGRGVLGEASRIGDAKLARQIGRNAGRDAAGSSRNAPRNRTVPSWTAKPSRM